MTIDPIFAYANYAEACLWTGLGVIAIARRNSRWSVGLTIALLGFGVSDIVEVRTGAWYRPWWLLAWKATCVLLILVFGASVARRRAKIRQLPAS